MKNPKRFIILLFFIINYSLLAQSDSPSYRNVMYYGDWSIYSGLNHFFPSKIDANLITHLIFAYLDMDSNGDLVLYDEYADFKIVTLPELEGINYGEPYGGVLGALSILKVKYPHLKLGVSVGGPKRSGDFSEVCSDRVKRQNFATNIVKFVDFLGFDFVDINWQFPNVEIEGVSNEKEGEINEGSRGNPEDSKNLILLLEEIRKEFDSKERDGIFFEISVAMSSSPEILEKIQFDKILQIVNFANLMTYDLNGAWNSYTAHQTPLYTNEAYDQENMPEAKFSIDSCINYLIDKYGNEIDMKKIVIGVAPYTRGWLGVKDDGLDKDNPGLYATANPNSVRSFDGTTSGIYGFHELPSLIKQFNLVQYFDNTAKAAYYYSPSTGYFFTCDNEESVAAKGKYVKEKGLGGLFAWISFDQENEISKAMFNSLYEEGYKFPEKNLIYTLFSISSKIKATEDGYNFTIQNNAALFETNPALKNAELFQKNIFNMIVYIKTKSGTKFIAGPGSGNITFKDGENIIDPSSNYESRIVPAGLGKYTFNVKISGTPNVDDIATVFVSQRILPSLKEFKKRIVYRNE